MIKQFSSYRLKCQMQMLILLFLDTTLVTFVASIIYSHGNIIIKVKYANTPLGESHKGAEKRKQ